MTRYQNVVIRASAGTGKTFQLSSRYLGLLLSGAQADEILATTFTRKAAAEILDRIIARLAEACLDDGRCARLAAELQVAPLTPAQCLALLERLLHDLHRLRVATLDSFFASIASSFSLELGLPPGWRIVDELQDARLRTEAIETVLREDGSRPVSRLMHLLTKGETDRSVSELVRSTVNQLYGLYLETTPEAWHKFPQPSLLSAEELERTIQELRSAELPKGSRFVSARDSDCANAAEGNWEEFVSKGLAAKVAEGEATYGGKEIPPRARELYARLVRHVAGVFIQQLAAQTNATYELLDQFDSVYQQLKIGSRAMRFEDITRRLGSFPAEGKIERLDWRLDARVAHLLFDEFQDTSLAQWQVVRPFAERVTRNEGQQSFYWMGGQQSFFCVGDVKQAIYGWRGGRSEIFDALDAQLTDLRHESLTESYRSSQPVIDAVNQICSRLDAHPNLERMEAAVHRWCQAFPRHSTARSELAGYVSLETAPLAQQRYEQSEITLRYAARRIAAIVSDAPGFSVGVLVRRNAVVARLIFELRRLGIEASEEGGNPLTDSAAVQLLMSLLRIADHPGDTVAQFHLRRSPLGPALGLSAESADADVARLARQVRRELIDDGYGETLFRWASRLAGDVSARDRSRLEQLVELAYGFQQTTPRRTTEFLEYVARQRVSDPTTADVRVMTVHQAKGLQFDIVVLAELDANLTGQPDAFVVGQPAPAQPIDRVCVYRSASIQRLLPAELRQLFEDSTDQAVTEALYVLYVALTRAVHALHMVIPPSTPNERSIHKTCAGLLRAALTDRKPVAPETVVYELGDRQWFRQAVAASRPEPETARSAPLEVVLAPMTGGRATGLERTTPSGLEGGNRVRLDRVLSLDNVTALARGSMIHAWFEQIQWLEDGRPDPESLRRAAEEIGATDLDVDEAIRQFHAMLDRPEIAGALTRAAYLSTRLAGNGSAARQRTAVASLRLEVHNERRFAVRDRHRLVSGTIDRLVLMYDRQKLVGADIIDFKTDSVSREDPARVEETVEHYRPQQEAYRFAVSRMFHLDPEQVSARLLLLEPGIVRDI